MTSRVGIMEFAVAADLAGVEWCRKDGCDHKGGKVEPGVVHMRRIRFTRTGLHTFLMAAYDARWGHDPDVRKRERWLRRYQRIAWVNVMAGDMNRSIPAKAWEIERARMREELSEYSSRVPTYARPDGYRKAARWSQRS